METGGLSLPDHEETERLVALALAEDVGRGDLTTGAIIPADARLDGSSAPGPIWSWPGSFSPGRCFATSIPTSA
ncbi:MAG: hypothetical protein RIC93_10300 [Alphaproteobacteria bacterium]